MQRDPVARSSHDARGKGTLSIRRLRTYILIALIAGVAIFTGVMFTLVQSLSERFGPQVEADLEWRALRGAQELSYKADLGLAVSDPTMVKEAFGVYTTSPDVQSIVARDAKGTLVAQVGTFPLIDVVFAAKPQTLAFGPGYVASWAPSTIEGNEVGKIAIVVSTRRLVDAKAILTRVSNTTLFAGLAGAILGALVILFFTRAVSVRDQQLADHAKNLEAKIEERTRELDERNRGMRLVLDNVAQGFITIDLHGVMAGERSAIVDRWFGALPSGSTLGSAIARYAPRIADWFELGLESLRDGALPLELCLHQLPSRMSLGDRALEISYSAISTGEELERILVIISDITEQIVRERAEREQRELVSLFQRITSDRTGFEEFLDEASGLVTSLATAGDPIVERRSIHTLKGNCGIYGLDSFATLCHTIESELDELGRPLDADQRRRLDAAWQKVLGQITQLIGKSRRDVVEVDVSELARAITHAKQNVSCHELANVLTSWTREPVTRHFERLAHHATALARRLGKGDLDIEIASDGARVDEQSWASFWAAMIHAVRNSVDHGIDSSDARIAAGKPSCPKLSFTAERSAGYLTITMSDDGCGIDWARVRDRARAMGLKASSQADLEQALFTDGLSTKQSATEISGRGVGMSALRDAVVALGGTLAIESSSQGTTLGFRFPELIESKARRPARPSQSLAPVV